jgi:hypothetical protein
LLSDYIRDAAEVPLPEFIADHSNLERWASVRIYVFRSEQPAKEGSYAKLRIIITRNRKDLILKERSIHFHIGNPATPPNQAGENTLAAFEFAKHWIGERDFVILADDGKFDEALGVGHGEIAEQQGVDEGEDRSICADAQGQR